MLFLSGVSTEAAVFDIPNGDVAGLRSAITTANSNGADDVINLAANGLYVPTAPDASDPFTAFPPITADNNHTLTINGNGATLQRSTNVGIPDFRVLFVSGGNVTIDRLTVTNGHLATGSGGGIANTAGTPRSQIAASSGTQSVRAPKARALPAADFQQWDVDRERQPRER